MVDIPFKIKDKEYRVRTDSRNWMICKPIKSKKDNEIVWEAFEFYGSLAGLMHGLFELGMKRTDARTIRGLKNNMTKISKRLNETFAPFKEK